LQVRRQQLSKVLELLVQVALINGMLEVAAAAEPGMHQDMFQVDLVVVLEDLMLVVEQEIMEMDLQMMEEMVQLELAAEEEQQEAGLALLVEMVVPVVPVS